MIEERGRMSKKIMIIGGGPGGYVAALRAAQLGARVSVVEGEELGGTCLNWGCVPTKTLLHTARIYQTTQHCRQYGIYCTVDSIRFDKMVEKKNEVVRNNVAGIHGLFKKNKICLIKGKGRILDSTTVEIRDRDGQYVKESANAIVIATGSRPLVPGFIKYDGDRIITTTEALDLDHLPASIAVIGGSVSGCEFACLFSQLGSRVHLIEMLDSIVPTEDREIARRLEGRLKRLGVTVMTQTAVKGLERNYPDGSVDIKMEGETIRADYCLLAMGRRLNTEEMGLDETGIAYSPAGIVVNDCMETTVANIYAVGDVTGKFLLAHVASEQGIVAVENIMGRKSSMNYDAVPGFIYTDPEIASVGLKAAEAAKRGLEILEGRATFKTNAMAHAMEETSGFVKTVVDKKTHRILGVHIFGPHATDLLAEAVTMVKAEMTLERVKETIYPHPTLCETVKEAVLAAVGEAIHA
jgi:dihydrolipoamide dehydrogenase